MCTNLLSSLLKKVLLSVIVLTAAFYVSSAQKSTYVSTYDCLRNTVSQTSQIDADSNNVYDTYGIRLCGQDNVQTFPLVSIGDISKWPPLEGPTRSIVLDTSNSISLLETFYNNYGSVIAWFIKSEGNDTVYFHEENDYNPVNYTFDSSASHIQAFPNPADEVLKIHYVVTDREEIQIQLLDYEGNFLAQILRSPSGQGDYMMVFPVAQYSSGYYRLRFIAGSNNYMITFAIVH